MKRFLAPLGLVQLLALVLASTAFGAPKHGCPTAFDEMTVAQVAAYVWPRLVDQSPWPGGVEQFAAESVATYDKNADGSICIKVKRFTNPNSHWYRLGIEMGGDPIEFINPIDNNANASISR